MGEGIAVQRVRSSHDREAYWAAKNERKAQSELDRQLCPQPSARVLNQSYREVAGAMREHGVTDPLTLPQARRYRDGLDQTPDWLDQLRLRTHGAGPLSS